MNQTQKGVLIAIVVALLGGVAYMVFKPDAGALKNAANQVAATAGDAAKQAGSLVDLGSAVDKTSRLLADAGAATVEMRDLFKDGRIPDASSLKQARVKIETALIGVTSIEIPTAAEGAPADMLKKARDNAKAALDILKTLPEDPAGVMAALGKIEAALAGKAPADAPIEATAPAAPASTLTPAAATATTAAAETPAATPAVATEATAEPVAKDPFPAVPAFDLLRVEPDGSTIIAGRAAEGDKIEILDSGKVVSTTQASTGGDFAAVFENPLGPGDHQLIIRATAKDGKATDSEEVATVSVPAELTGDLLAMVSKPGEASRVITAPGTKLPGNKVAGGADETTADGKTARPAAATETADAATTTTPATPAEPTPATPEPATVKAALQISAVELEGDRIFVAGTADPKSKVMAYADDTLIGASETGDDGHFVIDGIKALSVGGHKIRVDQEGADGKLAFRAEVPFDRPEGEQVAAVATPAKGDTAAGATTMTPLGDGTFDRRRDEAVKAFALLQKLFEGGKTPAAEELAAARSATEIALQSLADFALPADADQASRDMVAKTHATAAKALALLKTLPTDAAEAGPVLSSIGDLIRQTVSPSGGGDQPAATPDATAPVAEAPAATPAPAPATTAEATGEPAKVAQAPLTGSSNTVIIRKGDTLWQISRRVYGLGVRYTTIYMANKEQIRNPDQILPGQVFGVPNEALPNAEELHRQRLKGETAQ